CRISYNGRGDEAAQGRTGHRVLRTFAVAGRNYRADRGNSVDMRDSLRNPDDFGAWRDFANGLSGRCGADPFAHRRSTGVAHPVSDLYGNVIVAGLVFT